MLPIRYLTVLVKHWPAHSSTLTNTRQQFLMQQQGLCLQEMQPCAWYGLTAAGGAMSYAIQILTAAIRS